jgi:hypothetical protein
MTCQGQSLPNIWSLNLPARPGLARAFAPADVTPPDPSPAFARPCRRAPARRRRRPRDARRDTVAVRGSGGPRARDARGGDNPPHRLRRAGGGGPEGCGPWALGPASADASLMERQPLGPWGRPQEGCRGAFFRHQRKSVVACFLSGSQGCARRRAGAEQGGACSSHRSPVVRRRRRDPRRGRCLA